MKRTIAKDVILLCKGWYNHNSYPTILDALKQYYRKNYCDMDFSLNEKFLLRVVLIEVMIEISEKYPDRLREFIKGYLIYGETIFGVPDESNNDYDYKMFYKIVNFIKNLKMKGDGIVEIDTSNYFVEDLQDQHSQITRKHLPYHNNKRCLREDII